MLLQLLHRKVGTEECRQVFLHPVLEDDAEHFITDPGGIGFRSDVVQHQDLRLLHGIDLFVDRVALDRLLHLHREGRVMHQCRQMATHRQFMRNRTQQIGFPYSEWTIEIKRLVMHFRIPIE